MAASDFPPPPAGFGQPIPEPTEPTGHHSHGAGSGAFSARNSVSAPIGVDISPEHGFYSPSAAVTACLRSYAKFRGRAPRSQFWWFYLFVSLVFLVASAIDVQLGYPVSQAASQSPQYGPATTAVGFALFLPLCAVYSRRMHDVGRTGLYIFWVITGIGVFWVLVRLFQSGGVNTDNGYGVRP